MSEEMKKEILKAKFWGYAPYQIAENTGFEISEINKVIEEGKEYLKELGETYND